MKIRVLGGGLYGCHVALNLLRDGHEVELHEISDRLFSGASGNIPARLHTGAHYPRSMFTRKACQKHYAEFMKHYGDFTRHVPVNIYAIAEKDSIFDFGTYKKILHNEVPFLKVSSPREFGLQNVEGAIQIDERHIIVDQLREFFEKELSSVVRFGMKADSRDWDQTIDATFCANENNGVDRYEVCLTVLLKGPAEKAVTIMDGPFPSLYPWDEIKGICSLTSARFTPIAKTKTWEEAKWKLDVIKDDNYLLNSQASRMFDQIMHFYPQFYDNFEVIDYRLAIRAMPHSAADSRLVDVVKIDEHTLRIRAGKMDAIFQAMNEIRNQLPKLSIAA